MALQSLYLFLKNFDDEFYDHKSPPSSPKPPLSPLYPKQAWAATPFALFPVPNSDPTTHPAHTLHHHLTGLHNCLLRSLSSLHTQSTHALPTSATKPFALYALHILSLLSSYRLSHTQIFVPQFDALTNGTWRDDGVGQRVTTTMVLDVVVRELEGYMRDLRDTGEWDSQRVRWLVERVGGVVREWMVGVDRSLKMLSRWDGREVERIGKRGWRVIRGGMGKMDLTLLLAGAHDVTYPGNESMNPVPTDMPLYKAPAALCYGWMEASIWRFSPCDSWGYPRPYAYEFGNAGMDASKQIERKDSFELEASERVDDIFVVSDHEDD